MLSCPSRRGASRTVMMVVRRNVGAPFTKVNEASSDCEWFTTSKSLKSGSASLGCSPFEEMLAVTTQLIVPSSATSSVSVRADNWTSSAAWAAAATSRRPATLPIFLDILPPLLRPFFPEPPHLQILLSGPERVQKPLRLAPIHRPRARGLQVFVLGGVAGPRLLPRLPLLVALGGRSWLLLLLLLVARLLLLVLLLLL